MGRTTGQLFLLHTLNHYIHNYINHVNGRCSNLAYRLTFVLGGVGARDDSESAIGQLIDQICNGDLKSVLREVVTGVEKATNKKCKVVEI